jgi:hypothetical protein
MIRKFQPLSTTRLDSEEHYPPAPIRQNSGGMFQRRISAWIRILEI